MVCYAVFIEPIECSKCHHRGRPGSAFELGSGPHGHTLYCKCGNHIPLVDPHDQFVLSDNEFVRLPALSNHEERGTTKVVPGTCVEIEFSRPFEFPCRAFLSPYVETKGDDFWYARELRLELGKMVVLSSSFSKDLGARKPMTMAWAVYGLVDMDRLDNWFVLFYSAASQLTNGLFKPALFDYATSFEVFVESFLRVELNAKLGPEGTELLLRKIWKIEERCRDLLYLAVGHKFTERLDVFQPWDEYVRKPRNELAHGIKKTIGKVDAENAHQACYQAIRWIESLVPARVTPITGEERPKGSGFNV